MENKPNIRPCKQCGKIVDFNDPHCEHETMEESAWLDIQERAAKCKPFSPEQAAVIAIDPLVYQAATELGFHAAEDFKKMLRRVFDATQLEKHLSDLDHVNQHRSQR